MSQKYKEKLVQAFIDHSKPIERVGWKNNDAQEFCQFGMGLLKSIARAGFLNAPKSELKQAIGSAKLTLSSSEAELLVEKIRSSLKWVREKRRNAGSGAFLPPEVKALGKLFVKNPNLSRSKAQKNIGQDDNQKKETKEVEPGLRDLFGLPEKSPALEDDEEILVSSDSDSIIPAALPSSSSASAVDPGSCTKMGSPS